MMEPATNYGFGTRLNTSYEQAIEKVTAALKEQGFGVLTEIDVKATFKKKLDVDFQKYIILGACNPKLAHKALVGETEIGLLLPCNVIIYEDAEAGDTVVSFVDPIVMMGVVDNPELSAVASEAGSRLRKALATVSQ